MPNYILVAFQENSRLGHQHMKIDVFYRATVSKAQSIIGREKRPDASTNYD